VIGVVNVTRRRPKQTNASRQAAKQALTFLGHADALKSRPYPTTPASYRRALMGLVRLCILSLQGPLLADSLLGNDMKRDVELAHLFYGPLNCVGEQLDDLWVAVPVPGPVQLSDGLVLTRPWKPERYARALLRSGPCWRDATWAQQGDQTQELHLPWGILDVGDGNHSAASGLLLGDGQLEAEIAWDWTPALACVDVNAPGLIRTDTGKLISPSAHWELLALVGLGKRLAALDAEVT
jgi:hypothetical protein